MRPIERSVIIRQAGGHGFAVNNDRFNLLICRLSQQ
jgi:hypothetical protein